MNKKRMNAMLGSLTALCMTCTTMSNAIVFAQDNTFEVINENTNETNQPDWSSEASKDKTVFYNGQYFTTLKAALEEVYKAKDTDGIKEIHCKENANVGSMTHVEVADNITIYGNGAHVDDGTEEKDGERDLAVEYNGSLSKPITVTVNKLHGIAAWGSRKTEHKVTLNFNNCENMQRILFRGADATKGTIDINVTNCSFVGNDKDFGGGKYPNAHQDTSVHSLYKGTINITNTKFDNVHVPVNMNNKSDGKQIINITNSTFKNCAQGTESNKTYAAPIRVVAQPNVTSNLSVENCSFIYTEGVKNSGNGDILLGDGRHDASQTQGTVTLTMSDTKADVMAQKAGYYQTGGKTNPDNATTTTVKENEVVNNQEVTVGKPVEVQPAPETGSGSGGATVKLNPVYRAYNPNNGEHLYTLDEKEYKHVTSVGWDAEGVAFMAEEEKNGQALYRVYNPNSGLHHYTLDEKEKNTLVSLGWRDEKVAWYTSKKPQSAPVFRVYNPNDGNHHYTMNKQEKDVLVSYGWQDEGIAFRTAPIEK